MSVSGPLLWSTFSVFCSFSAGTVAIVARSIGEGDRARAGRSAGAAMALGLLLGILVGGFVILGAPALVALYDPEPAIGALAQTYVRIIGASYPFLFFGFAASTVLRACGDTRTPLMVAAAGDVVKVLLNFVLIYGNLGAPELGVAGAATASAAAWGVEALFLAYLFFFARPGATPVPVRLADLLRPARERVVAILRVTGPATLEAIAFHAGFQLYARTVASLGAPAMAAQQACVSIESFSFLPAEAFGIAAATIVGQKLGAGRPADAAAGARIATLAGVVFLSTMGVVYVAFAGPLVALFVKDPAVRDLGAACLRIGALEQPTLAAAVALGHALRGAGDTRSPLAVTLVGVWLVRVSLAYGLAITAGLGLKGIWMATAVDWLVRSLLLVRVYRRGAWKTVTV
jgi:putative MATE family efflux protein